MPDKVRPFDPDRPLDLVSMGRVAVDFYAQQIFSPLEEVQSFSMYLGGCPANISVGASRLGLNVALLSRVGTDDMGRFLRRTLEREGVETRFLVDDPEHLTALVVLGINPPDRFPLIFYRENCADMQIAAADLRPEAFEQTKAFLFTGTCLSTPAMKAATHRAIATAKDHGCAVVFDIDYRPVLWKLTEPGDGESRYVTAPRVSAEMQEVLGRCDLIVGTEEEVLCAGGSESLEGALAGIRRHSAAPIVLKRGEAGCAVYEEDLAAPAVSEAFPVEVLNVLGAGDAFMSGFLRGWLRGEPWETCGRYANANGALVVSRHGCAPAMASFEELTFFMDRYREDPSILVGDRLKRLHLACNLKLPEERPLHILAFDHRIQFERACDAAARPYQDITAFKGAVYDGFREVAAENPDAALIVDPVYGGAVMPRAVDEGIRTGMPIEASGVHPIEWLGGDALYEQILARPAATFVKVLWKYHVDLPEEEKRHQMDMLVRLNRVMEHLERRLMLELLMPDGFADDGSGHAAAMQAVYYRGVYPCWWKIVPLPGAGDWAEVTAVLEARDPDARVVVLGKGAAVETFPALFAAARRVPQVTGFAIGRSIFDPAWQEFLKGEIGLDAVPARVASRYREVLGMWHAAAPDSARNPESV